MDDTREYMILKPLRKRLEEASKKNKVRLDVVQQDYILSWLLVGIYCHPLLKSTLVFKGGTALKKGYFGEYRFSEDLDFSAQFDAPQNQLLLNYITEACKYAERAMNEYAPIRLQVKRYIEKQPHPKGQEAFTVSAQFPWQTQPLTTAMIEITRDEIILLKPTVKNLLHGYDESILQTINVYSLEEIVLEKLRAILQHTQKLHEREWCRSRARDYYDLWRIFRSFEKQLSFDEFVPMLEKKCDFKQVTFNGVESFFEPVMIGKVLETWEKWLGPLVFQLPKCDEVLNELKIKIGSILTNFDNNMSSVVHQMAKGILKGEYLYQVVEKIIISGGDVNQETNNGHRFLQLLIKAQIDSRKKLKLVKLSIDRGAKLDSSDSSGLTPYATAVFTSEKMIANLLLAKGAKDQVPINMYSEYYKMYLRLPLP